MNLVLFMTNSCNLQCKYCFVEKEKKKLDFNTYLNVISKYKKKINQITFFGGEPLLYFEEIKKIIKYNKENNINVKYNINTNGILLNDEVIKICKENNILLNVSIDGTEESNIINRCNKEEFNLLFNNIKKAQKENIEIYVNYVVTPNNIKSLYKGTKFLIENNLKKLCYMLNYETKWNKNDLDLLKENLDKLVKYLIKINDDIKLYPLTTKINSILRNKEIKKCNFGKENIIIDTDGNEYPCINFVGNKDFIKKDNKEFKNTVDIKKCLNCNYNKHCSNNCMCKFYKVKNSNDFDLNCEIEKIFIQSALNYCKELIKSLE